MKFVKYFLILAVCCILLGAGSIYGLYRYIEPQLPDVATLKDVRLQIPMQIYSADGELIAQYGEKRPYSGYAGSNPAGDGESLYRDGRQPLLRASRR